MGTTQDDAAHRRRVCAVCARVLDYSSLTGWRHTLQDPDDHPVVPVEADQVQARNRCDFCSTEPVVSFLVSRPMSFFAVDDEGGQVGPGHNADATWACCVVCDRLIRKGRWSAVSERAIRQLALSLPARAVPPEVAQSLRALHQMVAANMSGTPMRLF